MGQLFCLEKVVVNMAENGTGSHYYFDERNEKRNQYDLGADDAFVDGRQAILRNILETSLTDDISLGSQ